MHGVRRDVVALTRRHTPLRHLAFLLHPENDLAGQHVDRLILLLVILQAQQVARLDMEDLANVPIRLRPNQFVAPRLIHSIRYFHLGPQSPGIQ